MGQRETITLLVSIRARFNLLTNNNTCNLYTLVPFLLQADKPFDNTVGSCLWNHTLDQSIYGPLPEEMKMAHCFICVYFSMPTILRPSQKKSENDIWYCNEEWACGYWKGTFECCAWPSDTQNPRLSICKNTVTPWERTLTDKNIPSKCICSQDDKWEYRHALYILFHLPKNKLPALRPFKYM